MYLRAWWIVVGLLLLAGIVVAQGPRGRKWQIDSVGRSSIYVIETTGVCLYVVDRYNGGSGIAVVLKSQLPTGVGCQ